MSELNPPRVAALGQQLIEIHRHLRTAVADLLTASRTADAAAGVTRLRAHCLAFCGALERHHTGEERGMFRVLAERHPELRGVIEELRRDHDQIAELLRQVAAKPGPDEVAGLAAVMENHFAFEERRLMAALR